jgi:hypothetical protein
MTKTDDDIGGTRSRKAKKEGSKKPHGIFRHRWGNNIKIGFK